MTLERSSESSDIELPLIECDCAFRMRALLSYLEKGKTSVVQVFNDSGQVLHEFKGKERYHEKFVHGASIMKAVCIE